jgi:hypothetical protein
MPFLSIYRWAKNYNALFKTFYFAMIALLTPFVKENIRDKTNVEIQILTHTSTIRECVCVCVSEREREREKDGEIHKNRLKSN